MPRLLFAVTVDKYTVHCAYRLRRIAVVLPVSKAKLPEKWRE
nr:MAG TPA: hypothetical protein [Caudoviricetes sp.]